ncbi:MAG: SDR family oxidoreductase [Planctomycetes bacterium]|nr:SDR family oxidoreductase [Planctomycetota bacterium]
MGAARVLVTGSTGFLGPFVVAALRRRGFDVVTAARSGGDAAVDLAQRGSCAAVAEALAPDYVLHLAAMSRMADCAADPELAHRVNAELPGELAARFGDRMLFTSTDLVFDGRAGPYGERAATAPLSLYGVSKAAGEELVRQRGGRIARLPLLFGPDPRGRGASGMIRTALAGGRALTLYTNEYRTPLHAADAATGLAELVTLRAAPQVLHLPGPERCSRWEFGRRFCAAHGLDAALLCPVECQDATRPRDTALSGEWRAVRSLDAMLADG